MIKRFAVAAALAACSGGPKAPTPQQPVDKQPVVDKAPVKPPADLTPPSLRLPTKVMPKPDFETARPFEAHSPGGIG
jgi:hypothetical protein